MIAPESNLSVAVLSNSVNIGRFHRLSINLLDSCAKLKGRRIDLKTNKDFADLDTISLSKEELSKRNGLYAHPSFVFEIVTKGNQLYTKIQDTDYLLKPLKDGSFVPQIIDSEGSLKILKNLRFEFSYIEGNEILIYNNIGIYIDPSDEKVTGLTAGEGYRTYGIKIGMTSDEIKSILGEPDYEGENLESGASVLEYEAGDYVVEISLDSEGKKSTGITLYSYNY